MARTPLAESHAMEPRDAEGRAANGISRHGNAIDAAGIRAEIDARMASTMQRRGDSERTAAIRDLIGRIGEILSEEPDPPSNDPPSLSPDADILIEHTAEAQDVLPGNDEAGREAGWTADQDGAAAGDLGEDAGYRPDTALPENFHCDSLPQLAIDDPADWSGHDDSLGGNSGFEESATPEHPALADEPAANNAGAGSDRIAAADPFAGEMLANTPLGYWRLGERDRPAGPARDETGTAPGTWHTGPGSEIPTVSIPDRPAWRLPAGTVQFWMRPDDTRTRQGLIARSSGDATAPGRFTVTLESNDIAVQLHGPNGSTITARGLIDDHAWHQIAVTFGADGCEIWIDGTLVARDPSITTGIDRFDGGWVVGAGADLALPGTGDLAAAPFSGSIAELAIFDTQLGPAAIRGLYDAGINGTDVMAAAPMEPVENTAFDDPVEPVACIDVISDSPDAEDSEADGDALQAAMLEQTESRETPPIESEDEDAPIDLPPPQNDTGWKVGGGWTVTLAAGTVEADDGVSLILSGDAAGTITLPDGSEIRFNRMARIDYGPRGA